MLEVDHDKIILLSTLFPTIPMLGTNCCFNVILFYFDHVVLSCIVRVHLQGSYQHTRNLFAYRVILLLININRMVVTVVHMLK